MKTKKRTQASKSKSSRKRPLRDRQLKRCVVDWYDFIISWAELYSEGVDYNNAAGRLKLKKSAITIRLLELAHRNIFLPRLKGQHTSFQDPILRKRAERFAQSHAKRFTSRPSPFADVGAVTNTLFRLVPVKS